MTASELLQSCIAKRKRFYAPDVSKTMNSEVAPSMVLLGNDAIAVLQECVAGCTRVLNEESHCPEAYFERGLLHLLLCESNAAAEDFLQYLQHLQCFTASKVLLAVSSLPRVLQREVASEIISKFFVEATLRDMDYFAIAIILAGTYLPDQPADFISSAERLLQEAKLSHIDVTHTVWMRLLLPLREAYRTAGEQQKCAQVEQLLKLSRESRSRPSD